MSENYRSSVTTIRSWRLNWGLLGVPAVGLAGTAVSSVAALGVTGLVGMFVVGYDPSPTQPANAYASAHYQDAYLTSHPLLLAAWCALVVAGTGLTAARRGLAAALLVGAAAILPWIPAMAFLHHVWDLVPS
ncbi:MAG TPA: hypothetical protein VH478_08970 [Trebonia sp.]|jgi:hypothetical protein|nr:hypothetical protein [Trebonia sp.]